METAMTITKEYSEAVELHSKIMANAELAAGALLEMCSAMKEMRDNELYKQFGFKTFDEYCEEKVGIKARQAYNYISTYEKLGSSVLQSNAKLGITKLELIAQLPAVERVEGLEAGEFDGMSAKELRELVKKSREQGEQLSLLQTKTEEQAAKLYDKGVSLLTAEKELEEAVEEKEKLAAELEKMKAAPVEVAVQQPSASEIEKLRAEIRAELEQGRSEPEQVTEAEIAERVEAAVKEAGETAKKEAAEKQQKLKEKQKKLQEQLNAAQEKTAALQKQLEMADPNKAAAAIHFKEMQDDYNKMMESIGKMEQEEQEKFKAAVKKALSVLIERLE